MQDLLEHPTFEKDFTAIAKGLPDLERIVSRIHAKNCKVKDFIKVLGVSPQSAFNINPFANTVMQAFRSLSKGLSALAETADSFDSKSIPGLLRTAPDLTPNLKHIQAMFKPPESGQYYLSLIWARDAEETVGSDELCPEDGKDEVYDGIMEEINELENELKSELKKLRKQTGYVLFLRRCRCTILTLRSLCQVGPHLLAQRPRHQGKALSSARTRQLFLPAASQEIYLVQTQGKERDKAPKGWTLSGSTKVMPAYSHYLVLRLTSKTTRRTGREALHRPRLADHDPEGQGSPGKPKHRHQGVQEPAVCRVRLGSQRMAARHPGARRARLSVQLGEGVERARGACVQT